MEKIKSAYNKVKAIEKESYTLFAKFVKEVKAKKLNKVEAKKLYKQKYKAKHELIEKKWDMAIMDYLRSAKSI